MKRKARKWKIEVEFINTGEFVGKSVRIYWGKNLIKQAIEDAFLQGKVPFLKLKNLKIRRLK